MKNNEECELYEKRIRDGIRALRMEYMLSGKEVSLSIQQNESYISRIESGTHMPSLTSFFRLCYFFQIEPELFFLEDKEVPNHLKPIYKLLREMPREHLERIYDILLEIPKKGS